MKLNKILLLIGMSITLSGCYQDEPDYDNSVVKLEMVREKNDLDRFIKEKFTNPYNLDLRYRFLKREHNKSFHLEPVAYDKAVVFVNILDYLYFQPYKKVLSEDFLSKYSIKSLLITGSPGYSHGKQTNGITVNGASIAIYNINALNATKLEELNERYMRVIYHESAHLLHQVKSYPPEYQELSALDYKEDDAFGYWSRTGEKFLWSGFISAYGSKNSDEDFVELIARYIINSDEQWEHIMQDADGRNSSLARFSGREILEKKLQIAKKYLIEIWNFDLDKVRNEIRSRYPDLANKDFNTLTFDK